MTIVSVLVLLVSGFAAGLIGGLLGLGGGIVIVPILVLLLKVPVHAAVATSLFCVIATSSAAASRNIARGIANVRLGVLLEPLTVTGAIAGGVLAGYLSGSTLITIFAVALVAMAVPMARGEASEADEDVSEIEPPANDALQSSYWDPASREEVTYVPRRLGLARGVSFLAGILSGLLGVGGGVVKVPILVSFCGIPMKAAAATSNFMIGVTAVASAILYYGRGDVLPLVAAPSVLGVFMGSRTSARLAGRLHGRTIRKIFAAFMILVAVQLLLKAKGWWVS